MDWSDFFQPQDGYYFLNHPEHYWQADKFGMDIQDVFTVLARQYNTTTLPLLDSDAFCRDVAYISMIAQDLDEFHHLLRERRDARFNELKNMFIDALEAIYHNSLDINEEYSHQWCDVMRIRRYNSFDTYVRFFANYFPRDKQAEIWKPPSPYASVPPSPTLSTSSYATAPSSLPPSPTLSTSSGYATAPSSLPTDLTPPTSLTDASAPLPMVPAVPPPLQSAQSHHKVMGTSQSAAATAAAATPRHRGSKGPGEDYDVQGRAARSQMGSQKRRREPEESDDLQRPAKRARADATPEATTKSRATRKRDQGDDDREDQRPAKRARTDANTATPEATATYRNKRKTSQQEEDCSTQARSTRSQPATKKRRIDTGRLVTTTITAPLLTMAKSGSKTREASKDSLGMGGKSLYPASQMSRVTRAQRRQLSREDAQLLQLGQHGELDIQRKSGRETTSKDTAAGKRRSAKAGTRTKAA
ncbi:hypothetical protein VM1G_06625 [Cytospora mali]|uniref:Uncharacterized protein n=1 Tax=Cytospora mali TaxID=578113 RepID=A0A194W501_CYTMA|nr:hypothetical protein VM1G_06625 [Valsa mali]